MSNSSSVIGFLIGLGKKLTESSDKEIDEVIMPKPNQILANQVFPRVALSYGILLWFTLQVIIKTYGPYIYRMLLFYHRFYMQGILVPLRSTCWITFQRILPETTVYYR